MFWTGREQHEEADASSDDDAASSKENRQQAGNVSQAPSHTNSGGSPKQLDRSAPSAKSQRLSSKAGVARTRTSARLSGTSSVSTEQGPEHAGTAAEQTAAQDDVHEQVRSEHDVVDQEPAGPESGLLSAEAVPEPERQTLPVSNPAAVTPVKAAQARSSGTSAWC